MDMKKFFALGLATLVIGSMTSYGGIIDWGSFSQVLHNKDGELLPRADEPENAGFIQLIHLGETGTYDYTLNDLIEIGGDGTRGDDKVIAQSWVGDRGAPFFRDGTFTATDEPTTTTPEHTIEDPDLIYTTRSDSFAIRIFDTPSPNYGDGFVWNDDEYTFEPGDIPTSGYYNYIEFIEPEMDSDFRYTLAVDSFTATTIGQIPEPSSLMLIVLASLAFAVRRRR